MVQAGEGITYEKVNRSGSSFKLQYLKKGSCFKNQRKIIRQLTKVTNHESQDQLYTVYAILLSALKVFSLSRRKVLNLILETIFGKTLDPDTKDFLFHQLKII